ncbi:MAG: hypothetical protein DWQ01_16050 [Planctomycetota bacterium]|nr:MAG: hypothetical protein DWQ01_16050 [Planctomycetota bacterium]
METRQEPVRVLFEGRYRKLVRDLPQTIFYCPECKGRGCDRCEGFGKLTRDSVQELIARVAMPRFKGRRNKFHGAGREDIDVRMLGDGRPFVFEVLKAKRPNIDLQALADEVNRRAEGRMEIFGLKFCGRKRVVELKETRCPKEYQARIRCQRPVKEEDVARRWQEIADRGRFDILQGTPKRVVHRRADLDRKRWLELVHFEAVDGPEADSPDWLIRVRSAHGTYIKEAISGEEGRTRPSLAEWLDCPCQCVELDVTAILPPEAEAEVEQPPQPETATKTSSQESER